MAGGQFPAYNAPVSQIFMLLTCEWYFAYPYCLLRLFFLRNANAPPPPFTPKIALLQQNAAYKENYFTPIVSGTQLQWLHSQKKQQDLSGSDTF